MPQPLRFITSAFLKTSQDKGPDFDKLFPPGSEWDQLPLPEKVRHTLRAQVDPTHQKEIEKLQKKKYKNPNHTDGKK